MKRIILLFTISVFGIVTSSCVTAPPQRNRVYLGDRMVKNRTDHDIIMVTAAEGAFDAIQFEVRNSGIYLHNVKVTYASGKVYNLNVDRRITAGKMTPVINLPGQNRIIRKVSFNYRSVNPRNGRAKVVLYGIR